MLFLKALTLRKIVSDICVCIIGGSCRKYHFFTTKVLSQQTRVCRDKHVFITTKHVFCRDRDKSIFVALPLQKYVCIILSRQKTCFFARKHVFVATQLFVARNICRDKRFVATNNFVATSILLSQQKT